MTKKQLHTAAVAFGAIIGFFSTYGGWQIVSAIASRPEATEPRPRHPIEVPEVFRLHVDTPPPQRVEQLPYSGPTIEPAPAPTPRVPVPRTPARPRPRGKPVYGSNDAPIID
jgi:hypothetical protein